jgi:hypothetical protein
MMALRAASKRRCLVAAWLGPSLSRSCDVDRLARGIEADAHDDGGAHRVGRGGAQAPLAADGAFTSPISPALRGGPVGAMASEPPSELVSSVAASSRAAARASSVRRYRRQARRFASALAVSVCGVSAGSGRGRARGPRLWPHRGGHAQRLVLVLGRLGAQHVAGFLGRGLFLRLFHHLRLFGGLVGGRLGRRVAGRLVLGHGDGIGRDPVGGLGLGPQRGRERRQRLFLGRHDHVFGLRLGCGFRLRFGHGFRLRAGVRLGLRFRFGLRLGFGLRFGLGFRSRRRGRRGLGLGRRGLFGRGRLGRGGALDCMAWNSASVIIETVATSIGGGSSCENKRSPATTQRIRPTWPIPE